MWQRWMIVHKVVLKTVLPVLKILPHRLAHSYLGTMGRLDLVVVPHQRDHYRDAVARAANRLGESWDVDRTVERLASQTYRWRVRDLLLDADGRKLDRLFDVRGLEHLQAALERRKGVVLLANHFGSHVATSHWLFRKGYDLRWFSEKPRNVSKFLSEKLRGDGPTGQDRLFISRKQTASEAAASILRTGKVLSAGLIVKVACDVRWSGPHTASAKFLGQESTFSKTWVVLAAMSGASVVPVFCRCDDTGVFHLEFLEPYSVPTAAAHSEQGSWWVQNALNQVEARVREFPEQSNDYFFWTEDDLRKVA